MNFAGPACALIFALLLVGCTKEASDPSLRTLDIGGTSEVHDPAREVIRDEASYDAWWERHAALRDLTTGAPAPRPASMDVDFARELVVAVHLGERPNGCHSVRVEGPDLLENGSVSLTVQPILNGTSCSQAIVHPYHIVALSPRVDVLFVEADPRQT